MDDPPVASWPRGRVLGWAGYARGGSARSTEDLQERLARTGMRSAPRGQPAGAPRGHLRPPRPQRRREDDAPLHPRHPPLARRRLREHSRPRRGPRGHGHPPAPQHGERERVVRVEPAPVRGADVLRRALWAPWQGPARPRGNADRAVRARAAPEDRVQGALHRAQAAPRPRQGAQRSRVLFSTSPPSGSTPTSPSACAPRSPPSGASAAPPSS